MPARKRPEPTEPLFDDEAAPDAPLAARMRPRVLDEFVGQPNLVGDGGARETRVRLGDSHGDARQDAAALISHRTADLSSRLRPRVRARDG